MNTRDADATEIALWLQYKTRFDAKVKPMIEALRLFSSFGEFMGTAVKQISGQNVVIVSPEQQARIENLYYRMQILDRQISGVLLKKYFIKFDDDKEIGIFADSANESDIFPPWPESTVSGFGIAPVLIGMGIAAVTLLAGGFITLRVMETNAESEAKEIMARMQKVDAEMMKLPAEKRSQWESWRKSAMDQVKAQAAKIPGVSGLLSRFLGSKGASMAIAGGLAIAALYFLIPRLRRN